MSRAPTGAQLFPRLFATEHDPVRRTKQSTVPYSVLGGPSQWYEATFVADDHGVVSNPIQYAVLRLKSDRGEFWQDCSSSKSAWVDRVGFLTRSRNF